MRVVATLTNQTIRNRVLNNAQEMRVRAWIVVGPSIGIFARRTDTPAANVRDRQPETTSGAVMPVIRDSCLLSQDTELFMMNTALF